MAKKIYSVIVGLLPILYLLNITVHGITFDRILLILYTPMIFFAYYREKPKVTGILFACIYLIYITASSFVFKTSGITGVAITWLFILNNLLYGGTAYLIPSITRKTIETVSIIGAVIIIVQTIIYYGFNLQLTAVPLSIYWKGIQEQYSYLLHTNIDYSGLYRPCAFFLEPAHYSQYALVGLASYLYNTGKWSKLNAIVISISLLLSTSGLGIVITAIIWLGALTIYMPSHIKGKRIKYILIIGLPAIIAITVFISSGFLRGALYRISPANSNNALAIRMKYVKEIFAIGTSSILFGTGFDNSFGHKWVSAIFLMIYQVGIIGCTALFSFIISIFRKSDEFQKCIIVIFVILYILADIGGTMYIVFYLSLCVTSQNIGVNDATKGSINLHRNLLAEKNIETGIYN